MGDNRTAENHDAPAASIFGSIRAEWDRKIAVLNQNAFDRGTRVALAMGLLATFAAVTAYRASEQDLKATTCERRLGEAQTYELVQRQLYLDKLAQHERWSDRYAVAIGSASRLLRQSDAVRENPPLGVGPSSELLGLEAQIEAAAARTLTPIAQFTDPGLAVGPTLEPALRARAQQDVRNLGLPTRCTSSDLPSRGAPSDEYLFPLQQQVDARHTRSLQDSRSVVGFVIILLLFTFAEALHGRARTVFETSAIILLPLAICFSIFQSDDHLIYVFFFTAIAYSGVFHFVWTCTLILGIPDGRGLQWGGTAWRWYRVLNAVFIGVYATVVLLAIAVPWAITSGIGYKWPFLAGVTLILGGLGWVARLALIIEAERNRGHLKTKRGAATINILWPVAVFTAILAFFVALPIAAFQLPRTNLTAFAAFIVLLMICLVLVRTATHEWRGPLHLDEPERLECEQAVRRLARTGPYVMSLFACSGLFLLGLSLTFLHDTTAYKPATVLALLAVLVNSAMLLEHIVHCTRSVEASCSSPSDAADNSRPSMISIHRSAAALFAAVGTLLAIALTFLLVGGVWFYLAVAMSILLLTALLVLIHVVDSWMAPYRERLGLLTPLAQKFVAPSPAQRAHAVEPFTTVPDPSPAREVLLRRVQGVFAVVLAMAIALTALFSAFAGFGYSSEHLIANDSAARAAEIQFNLQRGSTRQAVRVYHDIERQAAYRQARLRLSAATQLSADARVGAIAHDSYNVWEHEARLRTVEADVLSHLLASEPGAISDSQDTLFPDTTGRTDDPSFLEQLFTRAIVESSARDLALWDAYEERATSSEQRATTLLGAIALFSIALYLFAQALQMGDRTAGGYFLAFFASLVVTGGVLLAAGVIPPLRSIDALVTVPDECHGGDEAVTASRANAAAQCYGYGELLTRLARTEDDIARAHAAYVAATRPDLRPDFAIALYRAAAVSARFATPHGATALTTKQLKDELGRLVEEDRDAIRGLNEHGRVVSASLLDSFMFHQYLHGLMTDNAAEMLSSKQLADGEPLKSATELSIKYHRAVVTMATGLADGITTPYADIIGAEDQSGAMSFSAISDLEILRAHCPRFWKDQGKCGRLFSLIESSEEALVAGTWHFGTAPRSAPGPGPGRSRVFALLTKITPGSISWRTEGLDVALRDGAPVLMIFRYEPAWNAWYVIPQVSGPLRQDEFRQTGRTIIGERRTLGLLERSACLKMNGRYRIAFYAEPRNVVRQDVEVSSLKDEFTGVSLPEQGAALCVPSGVDAWQRDAIDTETESVGYSAKDGMHGVRSFLFFARRERTGLAAAKAQQRAVFRALDLVSNALQWKARSHASYEATTNRCSASASGSLTQSWSLGRLSLLTRSWTNADGSIQVGTVWDIRSTRPQDEDGERICATLASLGPTGLAPSK